MDDTRRHQAAQFGERDLMASIENHSEGAEQSVSRSSFREIVQAIAIFAVLVIPFAAWVYLLSWCVWSLFGLMFG